mmetsp:Transcript_37253/g.81117  ORF Transcript_37253/g.81117 Transcript_37253/m.81117 type:complete len:387 (+) Transcript_37253:114-1274(+)
MASITRSSLSASAGAFTADAEDATSSTNSAAGQQQQQQRRRGGLGRKIPFGRVDVNTPNNKKSGKSSLSSASAKKKADTAVSSITKSGRKRATRLFASGGRSGGRKSSSSSEELRKSGNAAEKAYDFVSITTGRLVLEPTIAPYVDSEAARDNVDGESFEWNRLPAAITADYCASTSNTTPDESESTGLARTRTSSIFRGKSKKNTAAAATDSGISSSVPDIQRANPITADFDVDRHYTIHFDSYHEDDEVHEDTGTSTATDSLCTSSRLEIDESGGYVIPLVASAEQTEDVSAPSPSVDSIFRMMDDAVETVVDSFLCLHRASPIIDDGGDGDLKLSESTTDKGTYYQPESLWNKENNDPMEIGSESKLVEDEVEGYFIPCPTAD